MDIFSETIRPDKELFFSRNDPNDPKMGDNVDNLPEKYDQADIVILGCPQDIGVRRNKGRPGAARAPSCIRRMLYKFSVPAEASNLNIFDLGDTRIEETLEATHSRHMSVVYKVLKDDKRMIILGGGNDISYPDCAALGQLEDSIIAFNIDSHYDVREDSPRNSGTPYRQLIEGRFLDPAKFYEIAGKGITNSPAYHEYLESKGVNIFSLEMVRKKGINSLMKGILDNNSKGAIFWGFDMDVVRANDAPGVSASYPVGLTAEEICLFASIAGRDKRSRIFEITEVNPEYDLDDRTSKLAAMMILYFLGSRAPIPVQE